MPYGESLLNERNRFINRVRFRNGSNLDIFSFQAVLQEKCDQSGIPVAFRQDTLKTGKFFSKQTEDILIMFNPNHKEYMDFLVRITYQGHYAFLDVFMAGGSQNIRNQNLASGDSASALGRKILNSITGHNAKYEEERNYYTILQDCLEDAVNN